MSLTKSSLLLATMLIAASMAGCGVQQSGSNDKLGSGAAATPSPSPSPDGAGQASSEPAPTQTSEESADTIDIRVYGTDAALEQLKERPASIPNGSEEEQATAALAELMKETDDGVISLWKDIELLSVNLADGIVSMDIAIPDSSRVGAPAELLMVESMASTLYQLPFVQGFDILVEGQAVESMMGHVELEHPFMKE
ncbi:GerMN domain-containing protein [Paenibacillus sp. PL2-23]|uniref:GerMN domain-containing protein n=1 Tax=Paenibacillus sp. PL2-23 TaxID=2100729 RepID=UPI0030F62DB9